MIGILFVLLVDMKDFMYYVMNDMRNVGKMILFDFNLRFLFWFD